MLLSNSSHSSKCHRLSCSLFSTSFFYLVGISAHKPGRSLSHIQIIAMYVENVLDWSVPYF